MASIQPEFSPEKLAENLGSPVRVFEIFMIIIPALAVMLRFWARALSASKSSARRFWWDDWFVLAALPFCVAANAIEIYLLGIGVGRHVYALNPEQLNTISKSTFAAYFLYYAGLTIAKSAALLFYERVFGESKNWTNWFRWALWGSQVLVFGWWIGAIFGTIFMCHPVSKGWLPVAPGRCSDVSRLWIGTAVSGIVIDIIILLLPLPMLWALRMSGLKKSLVSLVFVCGYSTVVISAGRLITVLKTKKELQTDFTYAGIPAMYWPSCETPITIFSICLPSMFYLGRRLYRNGLSSLFSTEISSPSRVDRFKTSVSRNTVSPTHDKESTDNSRRIIHGPSAV